MAELVDTFNRKLEEKDRELADLRSFEKKLQAQVSEMEGRVAAMKAEIEETRAKSVDPQALAQALAPLLQKGFVASSPQPAPPPSLNEVPAPRPRSGGGESPLRQSERPRPNNGGNASKPMEFTFP